MNTETVTLFSKPGCGGCVATKRAFTSKGIVFNEIDVTKDENAYDYVTKKLGYAQMPVVETESSHWSGFDPEQIAKIR